MKEGNNCITPTQAVVGLKARDGLANSVVELVEHNREKLKSLVNLVAPMEKILKKYAMRHNDLLISYGSDFDTSQASCVYSDCPSFTLEFKEYSSQADGKKILCIPATGQCVLISGASASAPDDNEPDEEGEADDEEAIEGERRISSRV